MATQFPPIPPTATPIPAWFNQNRSPDPRIETDSGGPFVCGCTQCFPTRDLQLGSHEYSKLVEAMSSYANGPCGPIDRPRKTRAYREARATQWQKINWLVSADESRATLQNYARIFDDAFFFGALINRGRCEVDWDPCARKAPGYGHTKAVQYCELHQQIHKVSILITHPYPHEDVDGSLSLSIFRTLLHELCHAALMLYGCKQIMNAEDHVNHYGLSGHGSSFFALFGAVLYAAEIKFGMIIDQEDAFRVSRAKEDEAIREALSQIGVSPDIRPADLRTWEKALLNSASPSSWTIFWNTHHHFFDIGD